MRNFLKRAIGAAGYRITRALPQDMTSIERSAWENVKDITMTSPERVLGAFRAATYIAEQKIPGDVVECGVWLGGSSMAMGIALVEAGDYTRRFYLYDTFDDGMALPDSVDIDTIQRVPASDGVSTHWGYEPARYDEVRRIFAAYGFSGLGFAHDWLRLVKGKVEDTIPGIIPEQIALLRLDTDWYASTKHELEHLYPRLVSGGILIIDDYGQWGGARKAVDEYLAIHEKKPVFLNRLDYTGRLLVKP